MVNILQFEIRYWIIDGDVKLYYGEDFEMFINRDRSYVCV